MKEKIIIKKEFLVLFFLAPLDLHSAPPGPCKWTNIYENNKEETIALRVKPGRDENGEPQYETCDQAIQRREDQVTKAKAEAAETKREEERAEEGGGGPDNCYYSPPKTSINPNPPPPRKVEVKRTGTDEEGNALYESCLDAKRRAEAEWLKTEFGGHREDADVAITEFNNQMDENALSASEKAKKQAEKQQMAGLVAIAGGLAAGIKGGICSSQCGTPSPGCCPSAPMWYKIAAGLGLAGTVLAMTAKENEEAAAEYSAGLLGTGGGGDEPGDEEPTTTGNPNPDPAPTSTGEITTTGGVPIPEPHIPKPTIEIQVPTDGGGEPIKIDPNNPVKAFEDNTDLKWDPVKKTITTPDGKTYSAHDADSPEVQAFTAGPEGQAFKAKMDALENQIAQALDEEGDEILADGEAEGEDAGLLGAGGFSGYGGGGRSSDNSGAGKRGGQKLAGLGSDEKNKASKVAGMSLKRGKNRVGVSQDNIFEMIHRRYQAKRKKKQFIELF